MSQASDFAFLEVLGKGSFGCVHRVRSKQDNREYVIKEIDMSELTTEERSATKNEVSLLASLDSPYIVKHITSFTAGEVLYIVMEFCRNGTLGDYIKSQSGKTLVERFVWKALLQVLLGLQEIHARNIIHRDIKTLNILLDDDLNAKIADFGIARRLGAHGEYAQTFVGTPFYLSPELIDGQPYNDKADVWALGCLAYEMCVQSPPFEASNQGALIMKILKGEYAPISRKYSQELSDVISSCLTKDVRLRPSATDLIHRAPIQTRIQELGLRIPQADAAELKIAPRRRRRTPGQQSLSPTPEMGSLQPPSAPGTGTFTPLVQTARVSDRDSRSSHAYTSAPMQSAPIASSDIPRRHTVTPVIGSDPPSYPTSTSAVHIQMLPPPYPSHNHSHSHTNAPHPSQSVQRLAPHAQHAPHAPHRPAPLQSSILHSDSFNTPSSPLHSFVHKHFPDGPTPRQNASAHVYHADSAYAPHPPQPSPLAALVGQKFGAEIDPPRDSVRRSLSRTLW
eukprot:TRINITY_DN8859_c0_g1_i1.p1 TRINITY_DN8859_c0_g1~~TRINITY_DN8859_c0_g1_i1.p1  ORF type:complete len:508 (-),score=92.25 TRINITY_DN8859_c0_g1_i1:341-1864(-)